MGEVAVFAQLLTQTGTLTAITERVRFARARMGTYELIDFVVVLMGYALSGEPTLQAFYEYLLPFAEEFMALFDRKLLPTPAFSAKDVLDLYLHRGSFETILADEDAEQDADRWMSHTAWGQECFQILAQWLWNLRLELGQHLAPAAMRTTEFAPAHAISPVTSGEPAVPVIYGPAHWAKRSFTGGFPGSAFTLRSDGTLRCPADRLLYAQERRPEHDGSLRVLYAGRIGYCRTCPLREQCQEHPSTKKARRVSAVFWPLPSDPLSASATPSLPSSLTLPPSTPLLWHDWPRRSLRRHWLQLIRRETATLSWELAHLPEPLPQNGEPFLTREQCAHYRLSWSQRLARNARPANASRLFVLLHGLPARFFETFASPAPAVA